jgi:hypothetical protein
MVLQVFGDADLLLGSYNVPLEYDPDLIAQVGVGAVVLLVLRDCGCAAP